MMTMTIRGLETRRAPGICKLLSFSFIFYYTNYSIYKVIYTATMEPPNTCKFFFFFYIYHTSNDKLGKKRVGDEQKQENDEQKRRGTTNENKGWVYKIFHMYYVV
jgi:hypothetical protein